MKLEVLRREEQDTNRNGKKYGKSTIRGKKRFVLVVQLIEKLKVIDFNHGRCCDYDELTCIEHGPTASSQRGRQKH